MKKLWIIAKRELKERVSSRSFLAFALVGPLVLLALIYILFLLGGSEKKHWKVLVMDEEQILNNTLFSSEDPNFSIDFIPLFIDYPVFASEEKYQDYDLSIWVNEKIITNKKAIISYREEPTESVKRKLVYHLERRLDELMVSEFTDLSMQDYRAIKQPLSVSFKNVYDPRSETSYLSGWVGYVFGMLIVLFLFLFGMTITRSISVEKNNRIIEVLLSSASANQILGGKILGIGIAAFIQFVFWILLIGLGLFWMRLTIFPDWFDPAVLAAELNASGDPFDISGSNANNFVDLVYNQINFGIMLLFFILFFIGAYFFYGAIYAAIGASISGQSDGQQFIIPMSIVLILVLGAGYFTVYYPLSAITTTFSFLPFTSPVVMLIRLGNGFEPGEAWQIYFALFLLYLFAVLTLRFGARIYRKGVLAYHSNITWATWFKWLK